MESKDDKITGLVDQLITLLKRNSDEELKDQIQSYVKRINAVPGRPNTDTSSQL